VLEVWWNDALLLPLRLTTRERDVVATTVVHRIEEVEHPESQPPLADPRARFPEYDVLDVSDSRERRH
jgi:hypothetical protein